MKFQSKVSYLEDIIKQLCEEQKVQNNQLYLSEELKNKITLINVSLSNDIFELNYQLLEELYPKK